MSISLIRNSDSASSFREENGLANSSFPNQVQEELAKVKTSEPNDLQSYLQLSNFLGCLIRKLNSSTANTQREELEKIYRSLSIKSISGMKEMSPYCLAVKEEVFQILITLPEEMLLGLQQGRFPPSFRKMFDRAVLCRWILASSDKENYPETRITLRGFGMKLVELYPDRPYEMALKLLPDGWKKNQILIGICIFYLESLEFDDANLIVQMISDEFLQEKWTARISDKRKQGPLFENIC